MKNIVQLLLISVLFFSCGKEKKKQTSKTEKPFIEYTFNDHGKDVNVPVTKTPQRAVLFTPHATEMFLSLGLQDRIVFGSTEGDISPQFQKAFEKIPNKQVGHGISIAKENFLLLEPDFVCGDSGYRVDNIGTSKELIEKKIIPFTLTPVNKSHATIEDVYNDIELIGKVFKVENKASEVIANMKQTIAKANIKQVANDKKIKVMIAAISSSSGGVWTYSSLVTDLINRANGKNIFEDIPKAIDFVSFESIVERNPDIVFVLRSKSRDVTMEKRKDLLRNHPSLKVINAVKNNNIHEVTFSEIKPSVFNADFIVRMNKLMYKK